MGLSFDLAEDGNMAAARIKVVGVGGAGGNAIRTMIEAQVADVEFVVANTDIQALTANPADLKIQLGRGFTKGLGAGANPEVGKKAAMEDIQLIQEHLQGADMVFITAGMGGGTGTGAAPVIAQIARDLGALTVGVVTKPFMFEGRKRAKQAEAGLEELSHHVDTLITIPNQKLLALGDKGLTFGDAFRKADEVLVNAVQGISDLIQQNGLVNVDFADVKTIMSNQGLALMGIGYGRGDNRAMEAANAAINSPLLDNMSVQGATGILINFMGGPDMRLDEVDEAATMIMETANEEANIIFGSVLNPDMRDMIKVTVIATGFGRHESAAVEVAAARAPMVTIPKHFPLAQPSMRRPDVYMPPVAASHNQLSAQHAAQHAAQHNPHAQHTQRAVGAMLGEKLNEVARRNSIPPQQTPPSQPPSRRAAVAPPLREDEWDIPTFLRNSGRDE